MATHLVIPDCQVKPDVDITHIHALGNWIVEHRPDTICNIGDFADMPSLSSYDIGKKEFEGRRYVHDLQSVHDAQVALLSPMLAYNERQRTAKHKVYRPKMVLTLGNHEQRILRAVSKDSKLDGLLKISDLKYEAFGWEVHDFLEVVEVDGIHYSHYFTSGIMGNPAPSAKSVLRQECRTSVMGHVQKMELEWHSKRNYFALFSGIFYTHEEEYLGAQGNGLKPGVWILHNVENGQAEPQWISADTLMREYL